MSFEKLRTAIQQRIEEGKQPVLLECEVLEVDKASETCTVLHLDSDIEYPDVQLRAFEAEKYAVGLTVFPKKGCLCTVAIVDLFSTSAMMVNCGEVESVVFKMDGLQFKADSNGLVLNEGNNGGLPVSGKIAERLAKLEAKHDQLTDFLSALTLPVSGATAGPPASPFTAAKINSQTTEADISNTKIKH